MARTSLEAYLDRKIKLVDGCLKEAIESRNSTPPVLTKALRYSVLAGGKRLRPILCLATYEAVGGKKGEILPAACALELLHTFSLVHDDLPSMDNDDLRRGQPTLHKVFGEGMAVLAGDALQALAFSLLAQTRNFEVMEEVSKAIGAQGMIGGQVADLEAEGKPVDLKRVEYIHQYKTAALICASVKVGGVLGKASKTELAALSAYGKNLGLAFQIVDDILDVEGEENKIGKKVGSDSIRGKATYPRAVGLAESKRIARELTRKAKRAIASYPGFARLSELADYLLKRMK